MNELSAFQRECGDELKKVVQLLGREFRSWNVVKGQEEIYVEAELPPLKIWIYEDGACWQGLGRDRVFEVVDYGSLEELQTEFLREVGKVLSSDSV